MHGPLRAAFVHRRIVVIDEDLCVGCALCTKICPLKNVLRMDTATGKAIVNTPFRCAGCLKCVNRCPSKAIRPIDMTNID